MAQLTLPQIFQQGDAAFELGHRLPGYLRTAAWEGHVQRCPDGHVERSW